MDEATFQLSGGEGATLLLLGGRSWRAVHVDWSQRQAWVEPIEIPGRSLWLGDGVPLSFVLCQAQKWVLLGEEPGVPLTRRARSQMEELRGRFPGLEVDATTLERLSAGRTRWWTFAGLKANATLADHLTAAGSPVASPDNLAITFDTPAGAIPLEERLPKPVEAGALQPRSLALDALESLKFAFCTPQALCLTTLTRRLADPEGTAAVAGMRVIREG